MVKIDVIMTYPELMSFDLPYYHQILFPITGILCHPSLEIQKVNRSSMTSARKKSLSKALKAWKSGTPVGRGNSKAGQIIPAPQRAENVDGIGFIGSQLE